LPVVHQLLKFARRTVSSASPGFAAVDALVALAVLATTVALSLTAADTARRAAALAGETRGAEVLMRRLVYAPAEALGVRTGRTRDFAWSVRLAAEPSTAPEIPACRRRVEVTGLGSGRTYAGSMLEPCPPRTANP
jgi:hypothetical protein